MKNITTPIDLKDINNLKIGDSLTISGNILTARDQAHKRLIEKGLPNDSPIELDGSAIFHAGPIIKKADVTKANTNTNNDSSINDINCEMVAIGPTTSMRMNPYESDVLKMGVKVVIGKGGMDNVTREALVRENAVYLVAVGGCAALYVDAVKSIKNVTWLDLGMPEAIWNLEVENFGPLIVAMDCKGNSLFDS